MPINEILMRPEFVGSILAIVFVTAVALRLARPRRETTKLPRAYRSKEGQPPRSRRAAGQYQTAGQYHTAGSPQPSPSPYQVRRHEPGPQQPAAQQSAADQSSTQPPPQPPGNPPPVAGQVEASHPTVTFADVAGLDEAMAELREVAEYLSDPDRFRALGAEMPRGVLLHGLPGCGKTLLARALAGETGVPFYFASAAGFVEQFVGLGAARVRQLFEEAKRTSPCIVFIDELDAVGRKRDADAAGGREFDHTLNQLLVELDGFLGSSGVLVLGATNRPELIDPALLRPGRFDRRIQVDRPDRIGREQILRLHAAKRPFSSRVDWDDVAANTAGLTAAELANIVNEASLLAARRRRERIPPEDVEEASNRVLSGMRTSRLMGEEEKILVAVHEAGHSLLSMLVRGMSPPARVSIMQRTGAFGRSIWSAANDREIRTKRELMAQLIVLLGGRAAEFNTFGEPSTRAEDDLDHAAVLARQMVERWAMTGRYDLAGAGQEAATSSWSPGGQEIGQLLARAEQAGRMILRDNSAPLRAVAEALVERETLTAADLEAITGLGRGRTPTATLSSIGDARARASRAG
ncbi:MAG: AAA family ATPase [Actinomycetota bacterium]|nr:AAA family ATPase [Actinomycetota bacterium]